MTFKCSVGNYKLRRWETYLEKFEIFSCWGFNLCNLQHLWWSTWLVWPSSEKVRNNYEGQLGNIIVTNCHRAPVIPHHGSSQQKEQSDGQNEIEVSPWSWTVRCSSKCQVIINLFLCYESNWPLRGSLNYLIYFTLNDILNNLLTTGAEQCHVLLDTSWTVISLRRWSPSASQTPPFLPISTS